MLRVTKGIALFLEDHLERFHRSAKMAGNSIPFSPGQIESLLNELIKQNNISDGNVLLSWKENLKAFFIPHKYPAEEMYSTGVSCGLLKAERDNPNVKIFQTTVRMQADKMFEENAFYEVLLVNNANCITEGSRSNIFFIEGDKIITPPAQKVLMGITRQKTMELACSLGIPVLEENVSVASLRFFKSAFITGTSPKILPVKQIDKFSFRVRNKIVGALVKSYDELIESYVSSRMRE